MESITVYQVQEVVFDLTRELFSFHEPIPDLKTRYPYKLESCLANPFQSFGNKDLYPGDLKKISILFYLMIKNHPFQNGNKRIAMTTLFYALTKINKWLNTETVDTITMYNFAKWVASSPPDAKKQVVEYIEKFLSGHLVDLNID